MSMYMFTFVLGILSFEVRTHVSVSVTCRCFNIDHMSAVATSLAGPSIQALYTLPLPAKLRQGGGNEVSPSIFWYLCTTDKGSNEAYCRKMLTVLLRDCANVLFTDLDCMEHASHLITLGGLKLMDTALKEAAHISFKYFTACAIVTNVMRDCAKDVYLEWCLAYGSKSANECVKKLMPKCNSGRWGSIHLTEERFLKMGNGQLATVLTTVLGKKGSRKNQDKNKNKSEQKPKENDLNPDTLALEQSAAYTATMGKWRRYALETVQDVMWYLEIMHRAREPNMHFINIVRSKPSPAELRQSGSQLCQLVNGKMDVIMTEFNDLLDSHYRTMLAFVFILFFDLLTLLHSTTNVRELSRSNM